MGLEWSAYKKVKENTLLITTAPVTDDAKDDIFLLNNLRKSNTAIDAALKKDGFSIGKDQWNKKWLVKWFHALEPDSFDVVTHESDEEEDQLMKWEERRNALVDKWIVKLADAKDILAMQDSDSDEI